jgi:TonB-linked SusC/RagA family outer membrane protein
LNQQYLNRRCPDHLENVRQCALPANQSDALRVITCFVLNQAKQMYSFYTQKIVQPPGCIAKLLLIMRLTTLILITAILQVSASSYAQRITLSKKNAPLIDVLSQIRSQTGFDFVFNNSTLKEANEVSINVKDAEFEEVLKAVFKGQPLEYKINDKTVVVTKKSLSFLDRVLNTFVGIELRGRVTDEEGVPMPGVSVKVKNGTLVTNTDKTGNYHINVPSDATLVFSYIGFKPKEVLVGNKTEINISLSAEVGKLEEVVVLGYQDVKRKNTTSALASIKAKDIENLPNSNVAQMLQGKLPGVNVQNFTGQPGVGTSLMVRGNTKIQSSGAFDGDLAFSNPLYVIDGIPISDDEVISASQTGTNFLNSLNPNDIESIDVLKDASAAAIYGSRGANGVILIRTKRGTTGTPKISFSTNYGLVNQPDFVETLTGAAERRAKLDLLYHYGNNAQLENNIPVVLTDSLNPYFNNSNNYQALFYQGGTINDNNLTVSGGSESYNYRIGLGYFDEKGIVKNTGYTRYSLSANLGVTFNEKLNMQTSLRLSRGDRAQGNGNGYRNTFSVSPVTLPSSLFYMSEEDKNRVLYLSKDTRNDNFDNNISLVTKFNYKVIKNLNFSTEGIVEYYTSKLDYFAPDYAQPNGRAYAYSSFSEGKKYLITNTLNYNLTIAENHNINFLAGQAFEKRNNQSLNVGGDGVPNNNIQVVSGIPTGDLTGGSDQTSYAKLSFFGSAHYDYKEKYLIDGYLRRDASSRFGRNNRWAMFPSVSAAWIATEESFLKNVSWLNMAKLRVSYGLSGDEASIGDVSRYNLYRIGDAGYAGGLGGGNTTVSTYDGVKVIYPDFYQMTNDNLTWEESEQTNIGLDLELLNRRLTFTADAYVRNTKGQLLSVLAPESSGYKFTYSNAAGVRNSGLEFQLSGRVFKPENAFQWNPSINISFNKNMVIALPNGNRDIYSNGTIYVVGKPLNMFQMFITDGVINNESDLLVNPYTGQTGSSKWGNLVLGSPKWRDINGDFVISDNNNVSDITFYGDPNPLATGGLNNSFSYKNFSLSVFSTFTLGRSIVNYTLSRRLARGLNGNTTNLGNVAIGDYSQYNYWRDPGDNATFPAFNPYSSLFAFREGQSFYVESGAYFRIKNIALGYDFLPKNFSWMKRLKINRMKLFANMDNVAMFQRFSGIDAEQVNAQGMDFGDGYPIPKKYTFGLQVEF